MQFVYNSGQFRELCTPQLGRHARPRYGNRLAHLRRFVRCNLYGDPLFRGYYMANVDKYDLEWVQIFVEFGMKPIIVII